MNTEPISFIELLELNKKQEFGIVLLGAAEPHKEWQEGIEKLLKEEKLVKPDVPTFSACRKLTGNVAGDDGRTDLVLVFAPDVVTNVGGLAMWRLRFGDCSWMDDFSVNYAKDYNN